MLSTTLWWYEYLCAFEEFQHGLLYTFARYITGDRWIVTLARDLIYLIYVYDAMFCGLHIIIAYLEQTRQYTLYIFAYIARFGKYRSIYDSKRHIQKLCNGLGEECFSGTGLAYHDDVRFFDLYIVIFALVEPFVVVIYGYGEVLFCLILK